MYTTRASASDRDNSNFLLCVKAWMSVEMTCDAAEELGFAEGWDIHCSIGLGGDGRVLVRTVFLDCLQYILLLLLPSVPLIHGDLEALFTATTNPGASLLLTMTENYTYDAAMLNLNIDNSKDRARN